MKSGVGNAAGLTERGPRGQGQQIPQIKSDFFHWGINGFDQEVTCYKLNLMNSKMNRKNE